MQIDFSRIKLVIWDLDDTFWKGTLSEGPIEFIDTNIQLIKRLSDCGIINSICSKNDEKPVAERLNTIGLNDFFVFKSINWEPKGQRIHQLIKDMGLRPQNCLFLDDNKVNINEALHYSPDLMVAEPEVIIDLKHYFDNVEATDLMHKRLQQYRVLEEKIIAKTSASDNLSFLYESNTQVEICYDCLNNLDRIHELINRTNQLNYTKVRCSKDELLSLLSDKEVKAGYVKSKDKYGDYGIVGFFAVKKMTLLHFLFSCRTIGQGVEQYVYASIGYPHLDVIGKVANDVTKDNAPAWINQNLNSNSIEKNKNGSYKILFKGNCDLKSMVTYLNTEGVFEEFAYIGTSRGNNIEYNYHTTNILSFPFLSEEERKQYVDDYIFADEEMFDTHIFDDDLSIVFIGTMVEPNLGIYLNKTTGRRIAFGEKEHPLTDRREWDNYINNTIFTADNHFTREWLEWFTDNHDFLGTLTPEEIQNEYKQIFQKMSQNSCLCLLLGSETSYDKEINKNYFGREKVYKQINDLLRSWAQVEKRVKVIDFNNYICGQEDFTNNINHFVRKVYFAAATDANAIITDITGTKLQQKSLFYLCYKTIIDSIEKTGFFQSRFYSVARIPFHYIRRNILKCYSSIF